MFDNKDDIISSRVATLRLRFHVLVKKKRIMKLLNLIRYPSRGLNENKIKFKPPMLSTETQHLY